MKMWNDQLQNRTSEVKLGTRGKMAGATCTQTQVYLKPLLRKLKTHTLPEDILESLTEITQHLLNRNYLKVKVSKCFFFNCKSCYFRQVMHTFRWQ